MLINSIYSSEKDKSYYKSYLRGNVFLKNKQYIKAIEEYDKALKEKSDFLQAHLNIGIIYDQYLQQYGKAVVCYIKYLELGGERIKEVKEWIRNIANLKHITTDKKFKELKKGISCYNEGIHLAKKEEYKKAINKFNKAIKIIPYYVKSHYTIGLSYFKTEQYGKSYKHFMKVLKYDPDNPEFLQTYYYLGILHDDVLIKDYENALHFYNHYKKEKGFKKVEEFIKPIQKVNNLIKKAGENFKNRKNNIAIKILKEAMEIKPKDVRLYNNIAAIYINKNDFKKALEYLKKSLDIRRDVGDVYYNMACLYSKKGDIQLSLKYYKKGLNYFSKEIIKKSLKDKDLKNLTEKKEFKKVIRRFLD